MDRVFAEAGDWAIGADDVQWILYRRDSSKFGWKGASFVRSGKDTLARCMREKGMGADTAVILLQGLPDSFDAWKRTVARPGGAAAHQKS